MSCHTTEAPDVPAAPLQAGEDLGKLYDEEYYRTGCGSVPYARSEPYWGTFFGMIAEELIRGLQPKRVLDAGCALGFLVEAFWDRGIEAWGIDISPYAISQVRRDLQAYCQVGSIADSIEGHYDLITCIEVLEHMPEAQATRALENMTGATDTIVFSSTPYDVDEQTHFNVRPIISWLHLFREHGFAPDLGFDVNFVCDHAILFRRSDERLSDEVLRLYSRFVRQRHDMFARDQRIAELDRERSAARAQVQLLGSAQDEIQANLEVANRELAALIGTRGLASAQQPLEQTPTAAALDNLVDLIKSQAAIVKSLEFRMGGVEQRSAQIAQSVTGILESRIWRTMVKGGGIIQKLFRA
jgi:SAM-dependent methyltransferase